MSKFHFTSHEDVIEPLQPNPNQIEPLQPNPNYVDAEQQEAGVSYEDAGKQQEVK